MRPPSYIGIDIPWEDTMTAPAATAVTELIGVYHADGGLRGEAAYVFGKLLGTAHCSLCDITHSPVRRKPAWDAMVAQVGVPFTLLHLNEMPPEVAVAVAAAGSPVVLARLSDGDLTVALGPTELDGLGGSIDAFRAALAAAAQRRGWYLGNVNQIIRPVDAAKPSGTVPRP